MSTEIIERQKIAFEVDEFIVWCNEAFADGVSKDMKHERKQWVDKIEAVLNKFRTPTKNGGMAYSENDMGELLIELKSLLPDQK